MIIVNERKHIGGAQTSTDGIIQGLKKNGIKFELIEDKSFLDLSSILLRKQRTQVIWNVHHDAKLLPVIASRIRGHSNIFVSHGIWYYESKLLIWKKLHGEEKLRRIKHDIKLIIKQFILYLFSSQIVHVSNYATNLFSTTHPFSLFKRKSSCVIYPGTNKNLFKPNNKSKSRRKLGIREELHILLMIGRLDNRKNNRDAIKLLKILNAKTSSRYYLFIVFPYSQYSDFTYLSYLSGLITKLDVGKYVRFITGISNEDLPLFYQAADAFLMLSKHSEMFGYVTLEALSCGCPVFGYNTCATPEIVTYKSEQFLTNSGNVRHLSELILNYLNLPKQQIKISKKIVSSVKELTWKNSAANLLLFLNNEVKKKSS